jgi:hypothetical protein
MHFIEIEFLRCRHADREREAKKTMTAVTAFREAE